MKKTIHKRTYNRKLVMSLMQYEPVAARVHELASRMMYIWDGRGEFYLMHLPREWQRALRDVAQICHCEKDVLWDALTHFILYYGDTACQTEVMMVLLDAVAEFEDRKKEILEG